jgi:hypothetical protein
VVFQGLWCRMNIELSDASQEIQYFGWAMEHLPEGKMLSGLLVVPGVMPLSAAAERIRGVYRRYIVWTPSAEYRVYSPSEDYDLEDRQFSEEPFPYRLVGRYIDTVPISSRAILASAPELYGADLRMPGTIDDLAYQAMLASFLGVFDKDQGALLTLATLLLRGSLNRQLTIGQFLRMLRLYTFESELPTKMEVVRAAQAMAEGDRISTISDDRFRLERLVYRYANFASRSGHG